jgi:hypothetical protein
MVAIVGVVACRPPRVTALPGTIVPDHGLPAGDLPAGHRKIVFLWELVDQDFSARGEGVARIASPDSVRMDFFLGGGMGSGAAVLVGDTLTVPGPDVARQLVPPRALLWAARRRRQLPAEPVTVVRVAG